MVKTADTREDWRISQATEAEASRPKLVNSRQFLALMLLHFGSVEFLEFGA